MRSLSYAQAIREGLAQLLHSDDRVFVIGQGVWSPWYVGTSMSDLDREFGRERVIDSPVSEAAITGAALGAALAGMRPIVIHPRMDFMLLAIDQIVGQAANWFYMSGGRVAAPITIRAIVNRGGEQAAQHSQSLHSWFMHVPGLKVVMPSTAYDAKGLLVAVPAELYAVPIGKAAVRRAGRDVTVVATSFMVREAMVAAEALASRGVEVEVLDLRSLNPLDRNAIVASVVKTGRLVTADGGWLSCGVGAEVAAVAAGEAYASLKAPIVRVALPGVPAPMSKPLEAAFYPRSADVLRAVEHVMAYPTSRSPRGVRAHAP